MSAEKSVAPGSRRRLLGGGAAFLAGGLAGSAAGVSSAAPQAAPGATPGLPWKWVRIDPMEAGSRAYRYYFDPGGCGNAAWLGVLSLIRDAVGHPWTVLPDRLFDIAQAGYGGQGTLCGALGVAAHFFNLVAFDAKRTHFAMNDELFQWYSRTTFPTRRFDAICNFPKQVPELAKSPLCHVSVSQWTLAAGAGVTSMQKKDRCAKVTGEVVYNAVRMLNAYAEGRYEPARYPFEEENAACLGCHGAADTWHEQDGMNNQQGRMTCVLCHPHLAK